MFGINQSKNQQSSASTTNTVDSNNDYSAQSHNTDRSTNAGGNINEYKQTDNVTSGGGAVTIGEQGIGKALVDALTNLVKPAVVDDHTYSAGTPGSSNPGAVSHTSIYIGVAVVLAAVGAILYFGLRK